MKENKIITKQYKNCMLSKVYSKQDNVKNYEFHVSPVAFHILINLSTIGLILYLQFHNIFTRRTDSIKSYECTAFWLQHMILYDSELHHNQQLL